MAFLLDEGDPAAGVRSMISAIYRLFVMDEANRAAIGAALTDIAQAPGAVVVHCSAGKDRTGWVVALAQYVAGVDEAQRMAEFLASNESVGGLAPALRLFAPLGDEATHALLGVEDAYLTDAWDLAQHQFGGIDGYLTTCGVSTTTCEALMGKLTG
jgi:protein-tyrosine phosphatase